MPRQATTGRVPIKNNLINGLFFDGTAGLGSATAPSDAKIATKTVRVILRPTRLYSSTVGIFGFNTANWYLAFAGSGYRYSYFDAAGVQKIAGSSIGTVIANVNQEVIMAHSNDGIPSGNVYIDFYINGVFTNRVTNTAGDGGGAWGTALTVGAAVGVRSSHALYLAEVYNTALTAQDIADLWINKTISTTPIHRYIPNASASTLSDTGSGTTTDLALSSTFLTNDVPFAPRSVQTGRYVIRQFQGGVTNYGASGVYAAVATPASIKVASKTIRMVVRPYATASAIQGITSLTTTNYYAGVTTTNRSVFSYANNAGTQRSSTSANNAYVPGRVTEITVRMTLTGSATTGDVTVDHFINGQLSQSTTVLGEGVSATYGSSFLIGAIALTNSFNGAIYACEIYDSALTDAQIGSLATVETGADAGLSPVEGWYMTEGSGSTIAGVNSTLTITGVMTWVSDYLSNRIPVA